VSIRLVDYPVDALGFPKAPINTETYFFQLGAGWYEQTPQHRSPDQVVLTGDVYTGQNYSIQTQLQQFTYGQPYLNRFRIANDNNEFDKVMIQAGCKSPNSLVDIKSLEEIGVNRNSHTIYYKEVSDYSKVIKKICNNKIYTFIWTFMNHSEKMDKYIKEFYEEVKSINNLETITKETLGTIVDGHYSEYAHQQLADEILKNIKLWTKAKKKQSSN